MHNLDDMIEKYRYELMEFSKQNPIHNEPEKKTEEEPENDSEIYVPVMAQNVQEQADEFDSGVNDFVIIKPYENYEDFKKRNGSQGKLRVQVFGADQSFPIPEARVRVSVSFLTGSRELFDGVTDENGVVDDIVLPAPNKNLSLDEDNTSEPYALYNVTVKHPNFADGVYSNIPIFDSVKSIQPVALVPLTQVGNEPKSTRTGGAANG